MANKRRTTIKNLQATETELTKDEQQKIKGGNILTKEDQKPTTRDGRPPKLFIRKNTQSGGV